MGNTASDWHSQFQLTDNLPPLRKALHKQTKERYQLLTLFPSNEQQLQNLMSRIKIRTSKPSPYLLPLYGFWRGSQLGPCSSKPSLDLIFKAGIPLEEYLTLRRVKNESFSKEEIQYVLGRVAAALGDIREMREEYGAVHLGSVFVDDQVKLKDPIVLKQEGHNRKGRKVVGFPSPQKLYTYFDTLSTFEEHTSDLFSLGMLVLQLIYPHQNLQSLYKNSNSRYLNCCIDANQLRAYVNGVHDPALRKYVGVLTDQQPNKRREIYHLLAVRNVSGNGLKLLSENPYEIANGNAELANSQKQIGNSVKEEKANTVLLPTLPLEPAPRPIVKVDFPPRSSETQYLRSQTPSYSAQPLVLPFSPPLTIPSISSRPPQVQIWRPSHIFESGFRPLRENSDSTPINKINGNFPSSFRSATFDFALPKPPAIQYPLSNYEPYGERVDKVQAKFIESTYRSSFIPMPQTELGSVNSPQGVEIKKQTQMIRMPVGTVPQQKQANQTPHIEQLQAFAKKSLPKPQDSPQLQVKTSVQMGQDHIQQTLNPIPAPQTMIKFQSIPSKIVQSVNQLQKSPKASSQRQGFVVEQYDIGTRYQGFKKNGMRNGQGEFIYKQGSKYKGEWRDNKMEGFGTLYYPSGAVAYEGQWLDDEFDGLGTVYNDNPVTIKGGFDYTNFTILQEEWLKYEGQLKRDAKEGLGKLVLTNGEVYSGMFENDMVHGEGEFKRYNGSIIRGVWHEGLLKKIIH